MAKVVSRHNTKIKQKSEPLVKDRTCNCNTNTFCPLEGQGLLEGGSYKEQQSSQRIRLRLTKDSQNPLSNPDTMCIAGTLETKFLTELD